MPVYININRARSLFQFGGETCWATRRAQRIVVRFLKNFRKRTDRLCNGVIHPNSYGVDAGEAYCPGLQGFGGEQCIRTNQPTWFRGVLVQIAVGPTGRPASQLQSSTEHKGVAFEFSIPTVTTLIGSR